LNRLIPIDGDRPFKSEARPAGEKKDFKPKSNFDKKPAPKKPALTRV